jgi:ankyrin repeat protein
MAEFRRCVIDGNLQAVEALLADGRADPAAYDGQALTDAAYLGHEDVVDTFLADGRADPAADESAALVLSARGGNVRIVRALLADGRADPTASGGDAIMYAARSGHLAVVQALLEDGRTHIGMFRRRRCAPCVWRLVHAYARWGRRRPWLRAAENTAT